MNLIRGMITDGRDSGGYVGVFWGDVQKNLGSVELDMGRGDVNLFLKNNSRPPPLQFHLAQLQYR